MHTHLGTLGGDSLSQLFLTGSDLLCRSLHMLLYAVHRFVLLLNPSPLNHRPPNISTAIKPAYIDEFRQVGHHLIDLLDVLNIIRLASHDHIGSKQPPLPC